MTRTRRRTPRNPIPVAVALLVIVVIGSYLAVTRDLPFVNEPYVVKAAFANSNGIKKGSPVRIAGVEVGEITGVEPTRDGSRAAVLEMAIRERGRPIKNDAQAKIRPRIFLEGNFFVEISPGRPQSAELEDGGMIPASRTSVPVLFDDVLRALKSDVRADLRGTFAELSGTQQDGGAKAYNRSLDDQSAAYKFSAIVSEALLGEKPGDLARYIRAQGAVSEALDADPEALRDLISNFNTFAGALAERESDLRAGLRELPVTLRTALPALSSLNAAFPAVRRFSRAALPGVRSTGPTIDAALPLVRQLRGLVAASELRGLSRDLRAATPPLASLARESVGVLGEMRALSSCTNEVLVPFGNDKVEDKAFPATGPVHQEVPKQLVGLAGESRSFDANGQWFKVLGTGGPETFSLGNGLIGATTSSFQGVNPRPQIKRPPLRAEEPCENQEPPDLRSLVGPAPQRMNIDRNSPKVAARTAKAQATAVEIMRDRLKAQGSKLEVRNQAATREQLLGGIRALKARRAGK
jgi:virulence factor Mce-like protein